MSYLLLHLIFFKKTSTELKCQINKLFSIDFWEIDSETWININRDIFGESERKKESHNIRRQAKQLVQHTDCNMSTLGKCD